MVIPKRLKIGGQIYTVTVAELPDDECGECSVVNNCIMIDKNLSRSQQEVTLVHEILHAINSEIEEREIEFMAQALYQVFSENKLFKNKC